MIAIVVRSIIGIKSRANSINSDEIVKEHKRFGVYHLIHLHAVNCCHLK